MSNKIQITITVTVQELGSYAFDRARGESKASYDLPDHHNLPAPDINTLIVTAYDEYKTEQAEKEAEEAKARAEE